MNMSPPFMNHFSTIIPPFLNIFYWPLHVSNKSLGRTVSSPSDAKASLAFGDGALPTTQVTLFGGKGGVGKSGAQMSRWRRWGLGRHRGGLSGMSGLSPLGNLGLLQEHGNPWRMLGLKASDSGIFLGFWLVMVLFIS